MDYIIYRNVFLDFKTQFYLFVRTFDAKPADFFRERVHSLGIDNADVDAEDVIQKIIETCSNARSLWYCTGSSVHGSEFIKEHSQLQMLSIPNLDKIALTIATDPSYHLWTQSLRILDIALEHALEIDFQVFPNLTILSVWLYWDTIPNEASLSQSLTKILERNPLFECFVFGILDVYGAEKEIEEPEVIGMVLRSEYSTVIKDIQDPRLVVLPSLTFAMWKEEISGGWSYWKLAKSQVQRQRNALCTAESL
jgi:hypothetical protein